MATLEQFLRTGELGPIHPGMRESEVVAVLGPPPDESPLGKHHILKYGGLQLTFGRCPGNADRQLDHLGIYVWPQQEPLPDIVRPTDLQLTADTTIAAIRAFAAQHGLCESGSADRDRAHYLYFPSGARITVDGNKLHSLIFVSRSTEPKKQVAVSLSEETWNQVKHLAHESNRSVAQLCADWITQRANETQPHRASVGGNAD
jgi:hypothetical protein